MQDEVFGQECNCSSMWLFGFHLVPQHHCIPPPPLAGLQLAQLSAGPQLAGEFGWLDCWLTTPFNPTPKGVPQWEVGPTGDRTGNQKKSKPQKCTKKTESFLFDPEFAMPALSRPIFDPFLADPPPQHTRHFAYILFIF